MRLTKSFVVGSSDNGFVVYSPEQLETELRAGNIDPATANIFRMNDVEKVKVEVTTPQEASIKVTSKREEGE